MKFVFFIPSIDSVHLITSVEYPYVVPQPLENVRSSSPEPIESVTTLTKAMKLNLNKTLEGQGLSLSKAMKEKERMDNQLIFSSHHRTIDTKYNK